MYCLKFGLLLLKLCGDLFKQLADGQVLRADALAGSALEALGSLGIANGQAVIVANLLEIVIESKLLIISIKEVRNTDVHRATVNTVAAAGAGNDFEGI